MNGYEGFESLLDETGMGLVAEPAERDAPQAGAALEDGLDGRPSDPLPEGIQWAARATGETFAKSCGQSLTVLLRAPCTLRLEDVRRTPPRELTEGLLPLACLAQVRLAPFSEAGIVQIDGPLMGSMLMRLLGGAVESAPALRELTPLEGRLAGRILDLVLERLRGAARGLADLRPRLERVESSPHCMPAVPSGEFVSLRLRMSMEAVEGAWEIHLPLDAFAARPQSLTDTVAVVARSVADSAAHGEGDTAPGL